MATLPNDLRNQVNGLGQYTGRSEVELINDAVRANLPAVGISTALLKVPGYVAFPGYEFDPLNSTTGWTVTTSGAGSSVTVSTMSDGSPCLAFTAGGPGVTGQAYITFSGANAGIPYDVNTVIGAFIEVLDPGRAAGLQILVSTDSGQTFTNYAVMNLGSSGGDTFKNLYFIGTSIADTSGPVGAWTNAGGVINTIRIRVINTYKDQGATIKIRSLRVNCKARTKMAIVFDDIYKTAWTEAARIMAANGFVGTFAVNSASVGGAGRMTWTDIIAACNSGWECCSHTPSHLAFNSFSLNSICLTQTPGGAGAMALNGALGGAIFDAPRHVVVRANEQGRKLTITGLDSAGSVIVETLYTWAGGFWVPTMNLFTQVTSIVIDAAATAAIQIGQSLSEAEMLAAITSPVQVMLANGVPSTSIKLMFIYPQGEFNTTSTQLLRTLGYSLARIVGGRRQNPQVGDFRPLEFCGFGGTAAAAATLDAFRDTAIREGSNTSIYLHDLTYGTPGANQTAMSVWQTFWDNTMAIVATGKLDIVKLSEMPIA